MAAERIWDVEGIKGDEVDVIGRGGAVVVSAGSRFHTSPSPTLSVLSGGSEMPVAVGCGPYYILLGSSKRNICPNVFFKAVRACQFRFKIRLH